MTTRYDAPDYGRASPYFATSIKNNSYLDILTMRPIPARADDVLYTVEPQYTHRPDLLAHDLYKEKNLWWVFAQRNLNVLRDPVYDLEAGVQIYLPQQKYLKGAI